MEHTAEEEEHLQALHRNQLRLLRLINQLLDVAKVESGKAQAEYSKEDVVAVVRELVGEVGDATRAKGIRMDVIVPSEPVWLYIDREKFEQLLLNLLSNAFKFTDSGGRIEVSVMRGSSSTQVAVRDTGAGIPESKLHTIFDRFTQADSSETRQYPGTGIGLALVQSYVELHGGTIRVESQLGIGTTFTVSLRHGKAHLPDDQIRQSSRPATLTSVRPPQMVDFESRRGRRAHHGACGRGRAGAGRRGRRNIARTRTGCPSRSIPMARDPGCSWSTTPPTCAGTWSHFSATSTTSKPRRTAQRAWLVTKAWDPDLVVSDVMMPLMSGSDLCRAIKTGGGRLSRTPVMLVTARTEEQTKLRGLDYGADDYLLKPFLQEELLLRVRNLVSQASSGEGTFRRPFDAEGPAPIRAVRPRARPRLPKRLAPQARYAGGAHCICRVPPCGCGGWRLLSPHAARPRSGSFVPGRHG